MPDSDADLAPGARKARSLFLRLALWALAFALLWVAVRNIEIAEVWYVLRRLSLLQISTLIAVNILVLLTFSGRWWIILHGMGHRVGYLRLSAYRLGAFGVSYFTPGPQFGGEPLQVFLLRKIHAIPTTNATASVALEKMIELVANFTFLLIGLAIIARLQFFGPDAGGAFIALALLLLSLPLLLLTVIAGGKRPFSGLMGRMPPGLTARLPAWERWQNGVLAVEVEMAILFRGKPVHLIAAVAMSLLTWIVLVAEYWLMLQFLDVRLGVNETIAVLTTARLAFLTPLPGGLGALEAGQSFAFQQLGYRLAEGLSVGVLIRARDLLFGGLGLIVGSALVSRGDELEA